MYVDGELLPHVALYCMYVVLCCALLLPVARYAMSVHVLWNVTSGNSSMVSPAL